MIVSLPEETVEDLYDNAPCGYLLLRNDGTLLQINRTFLEWTGYERAALLERRYFQELLTVPGRIYYETHYAPLLQIQGFVKEVAFDLLCADGKRLPILLNATLIANAEGDAVGSRITIFDATDRRRYEQELLRTRRAAEQLAAVVNASGDAILTLSPTGTLQTWNWGAEQLLGYSAAEAIGHALSDLLIPPNRQGEFQAALATLQQGEAVLLETERRHKNGQFIDLSVTYTPHMDEQGRLVSISSIGRDIRERKRIEALQQEYKRELERQVATRTAELLRSNEDLAQFAYVTSHDLKAPLHAIETLAGWITEDAGALLPPQSHVHLQQLRGRVKRMDQLLVDLFAYSCIGQEKEREEQIETAAMVRGLIELITPPAGFVVTIGEMVPTIATARAPLELVLRNLLGNAIKHHDRPGEGTVQITAQRCAAGVEFAVSDNGPGIDPVYHERIFGLFQTLRPRDEVEGSGMGLAIVKKVLDRQGGRIWIESEAGAGATFRFSWPVS